MYSRHQVVLHDSFVRTLSSLDDAAQREITHVWKSLGRDANYRPDLEDGEEIDAADYVVQTREHTRGDYAVVCHRLNGWDGWELNWFFEYFDSDSSEPEFVVLRMIRRSSPPFQDLNPMFKIID